MAPSRNRRWILAVLLAVLFPALAVHVSCVAVIGPGSWGSGMEERVPELLAAETNPSAGEYAREFSVSSQEKTVEAEVGGLDADVAGKVFWIDDAPGEELSVIAAHQGATWIEEQHFYLREGENIREIHLDGEMILERPALLKRGDTTFVVFGRWRSWALPPFGKLRRYLRSYLDPTLRPEYSQYLYQLPAGPLSYWGPGHTLKPSPDRRSAVLLRSGALGAGYYSMHVWDFEQDGLTTIVSLREADPGSGRSFDYAWSRDSRAIHITGTTGGFVRRQVQPRSLDLVYLLADQRLYDFDLTGKDFDLTGNE